MSSRASMQQLPPGTHLLYTNETSKAVELVFESAGVAVRTRLTIGQSIELSVGNLPALLCLYEPEAPARTLELVRRDPND